jgi:hypothetical protein
MNLLQIIIISLIPSLCGLLEILSMDPNPLMVRATEIGMSGFLQLATVGLLEVVGFLVGWLLIAFFMLIAYLAGQATKSLYHSLTIAKLE